MLHRVPAEDAHAQVAPAVERLHLEGALLLVHADPVERRPVARDAVGEDAAREAQLEVDGLFDFLEARVVRRRVLHREHLGRFLARQVARRVERVDADVHHRPAAAHRLGEPPLVRVADVETRLAQQHLRPAELAAARHLDHGLRIRLVAQAVGNRQLAVGGLRRGDHLLALLHRVGHRLLDEHVLARLVRADGVLGVHVVRQHDVHGVDVGVVGDAVVRVVRVQARLRHPVLRGQLACLVEIAAHEPRHARARGVRERGEDVAEREAAQPDDRVAEGLRGRRARPLLRGSRGWREERRGGQRRAGGAQELTTG